MRAVLLVVAMAAFVAADNFALRNADQCKGQCQDVSVKSCSGGNYVRGLCPGKKNIQCCVPTPPARPAADSNGVGSACGSGGVCQLTTTSCAGSFQSGLCPGKNHVQCCVPTADPRDPVTPTPVTPVTPTPRTNGLSLPPFKTLWQDYPHGEAEDVKRRIGGGIDASYITNTCVIRVTRAMTQAGMVIDPNFKLSDGKNIFLVKGGNGKALALRVREFTQYVAKKFGAPSIKVVNPGDGTDSIPQQFMGKKGLIMFNVRVWSDATGHFDLWDGKACAHNCYFDKAKEVWLWEIA